ncbi:hypothetical protein FJQ87_07895 [Shewanella sp. SNU WT4]|uniref:hypothetical protein n=1 Tax=Shewanella sp. SNU WT4 TaxID=2590015 RepID=UPI00112D01BF|nr:hypothetical protein [Shewanella sp. SNU WT4]QDF66641.1 hypothetical protein FJQ87_07895 [Shewanella sp. SNU WT4]
MSDIVPTNQPTVLIHEFAPSNEAQAMNHSRFATGNEPQLSQPNAWRVKATMLPNHASLKRYQR